MTMTKGCGIALIKDNKILLGQRVKSEDTKLWSLPGGSIEVGENNKLGAIREVKEECGLDINEDDIYLIGMDIDNNNIDYTYYTRKFTGDLIAKEDEMINFTWFSINEILMLNKKGLLYPAANISIENILAKNIIE